MFNKLFKKKSSPEDYIRNHQLYGRAYKLIGIVDNGLETFTHNGEEFKKNMASIKLCIKKTLAEDEMHDVWKSLEYKYYNDAEAVLRAECNRLGDILNKRIELITYSEKSGKYEVSDVFNENNPQYLIESTNL